MGTKVGIVAEEHVGSEVGASILRRWTYLLGEFSDVVKGV